MITNLAIRPAGWQLVSGLTDTSNFQGLAISSDSTKQYAIGSSGAFWTSNDSGQTWASASFSPSSLTASSNAFAISSTGQKQAVCAGDRYLYESTNYGVTWVKNSNNIICDFVALSSDGTYRSVTNIDNPTITYSSNSGSSWSTITPAGLSTVGLCGITMSSNGQRQCTAQCGGVPCSAQNYAGTFTKGTIVNGGWPFQGMAQSSSGQYVALFNSSGLFVSSDYGANWGSLIAVSNSGPFTASVGMSGNGRVIIACDPGSSNLIISTNYGASFNKTAAPANIPTSVAINSTGSVILLACGNSNATVYKTSL
jgi:photosystem II stability/assembly factor-like uncharacterized protein